MFGFILAAAAAGVLGIWIGRAAKLPASLDGMLSRALAGYAALALVIIVLGSYRLEWVRHAMLLLAALGGAYEVSRRGKGRPLPAPAEKHAFEPFEKVCLGVVACALGLALIGALAPATSWDATVAHLALPADYVREGVIAVQAGNAYSAYPHLMHSLFTGAYLWGGERSVQLVNWSLALIACGALFCLGRRTAGRRAGFIAAAMGATSPIFIDQAGAATIDLAFCAFVLAALMAILAWRDDGEGRWLILAGVLAGSACGVRHTGYLVAILATLLVFVLTPHRRARWTVIFIMAGLLAGAPWLLRSYLVVGNPTYPFLAEFFNGAGPADPPITAIGEHESLRGSRLVSYLYFPWQIIMLPQRFDGYTQSPGPWVLLLGIPGLFVGGNRARALGLFSALGGSALFLFRQYARYYLPFFLPMCAVAAAGAERLGPLRKPVMVLLVAGFGYGLVYEAAAVHFKVPVALGLQSRDAYLTARVERYPAFQWLNENVPARYRVLTTDFRSYYIDGRTWQNQQALYPLLHTPIREHLEWMNERGIQYWLYADAYVSESPGLREKGLYQLYQRWRRDERFQLVKAFDLERPGGGTERVEIYQIIYD